MADSISSAPQGAPATALTTALPPARDHGGNLAAAIARFGGAREDWIDLSTGINPAPYPLPPMLAEDWTALPDSDAQQALIEAARSFWQVPEGADILAAPGASALIARLPVLRPARTVQITTPTYNEHAAAFDQCGWQVLDAGPAEGQVVVHPNNPTGLMWSGADEAPGRKLLVIDESFCDIALGNTHVRSRATEDRASATVAKLFSIENVLGSDEDDNISGNEFANHLDGAAGDDVLTGHAGDDTLNGGAGIDMLDYSRETGTSGVTVDLQRVDREFAIDTHGDRDIVSRIEGARGTDLNDILTGGDDGIADHAARHVRGHANLLRPEGTATVPPARAAAGGPDLG